MSILPAPPCSSIAAERALRMAAKRSNGDPIPRPLALAIDSRGCALGGRMDALLREIELISQLFDRDRDVLQLHWQLDLATPADVLANDVLYRALSRHFHLAAAGELEFLVWACPPWHEDGLIWLQQRSVDRIQSDRPADRWIDNDCHRLDRLPLGPGSHGCVDGLQARNLDEWTRYIAAVGEGRLPLREVIPNGID